MELFAGRILYDSARAEERIGTRAGLTIDRILLFGAPGMAVDLVVHAGRSTTRYVQGQVVTDQGEVGIANARVEFSDGDECATTDEFGEFALGVPEAVATRVLRIQRPDVTVECVVPLAPGAGEVAP